MADTFAPSPNRGRVSTWDESALPADFETKFHAAVSEGELLGMVGGHIIGSEEGAEDVPAASSPREQVAAAEPLSATISVAPAAAENLPKPSGGAQKLMGAQRAEWVMRWAIEVAQGMAFAHSKGVLHRLFLLLREGQRRGRYPASGGLLLLADPEALPCECLCRLQLCEAYSSHRTRRALCHLVFLGLGRASLASLASLAPREHMWACLCASAEI